MPEPSPDVSPSFNDFGIPPGPSANKRQQAPTASKAPQAHDVYLEPCRTPGRARHKPGWMFDYDTS